jgi:tryptophan synthase alpha chain
MAEAPGLVGADRIRAAFDSHGRRAALMPYLMGGFPTLAGSLSVGDAYAESGVDLVELGVPFSDPLADGPAIQAAGLEALRSGATLERVLDDVAAPLAERLPVVLMCYANPILTRGMERVAAALAERSVAGLIVPDMPAVEAAELREACDAYGVALVPLVAPTTRPEDVKTIAELARGFVYVVSITGVTGERAALSTALKEVVQRVREACELPAAVGFGVASAEQAKKVGELADGVIIGSRLVREIADAPSLAEGLARVRGFLREVSRALAGDEAGAKV